VASEINLFYFIFIYDLLIITFRSSFFIRSSSFIPRSFIHHPSFLIPHSFITLPLARVCMELLSYEPLANPAAVVAYVLVLIVHKTLS
jgi:hypothetical protein